MEALERWLPQAVLDSPEYATARTHRGAGAPHNERQEFLGDALLGLIVSEHLYERFPDLSEGELTRLRSHLVCRTMLSALAHKIRLDEALIVDPRQPLPARARRAMAGNALEAVVAAVYQVGGLEEARAFVVRVYGPELSELPAPESLRSAKAQLQELLAAHRHERPRYAVLEEQAGRTPRFKVECEVPSLSLRTIGAGERVREAEQDAAAAALAEIQRQRPAWTA